MHQSHPYHSVREEMKPGDIIAFGGNSLFSRWTKLTTRSSVTHIAIVMQTKMRDEEGGRYFNQVMEATAYKGKRGVMTNRLSDRLKDYDGDMWWLPLSERARAQFEQNRAVFFNFMFEQDGKGYDILQLFGSAVDAIDEHPLLGKISHNQEDFSSWFCSELVAEGLEKAGVVRNVNASEVTPVDICRFSIFQDRYVQLKGDKRQIMGFNSFEADNWGQLD